MNHGTLRITDSAGETGGVPGKAVVGLRIVVADDIPLQVRETSERISGRWPDWEVLTAGDGQEVLRLLAEKPVDLVLADIRMPKMDGLEMLAAARNVSPKTRIVFITAYPRFTYAQKALRLGAADILLKPVNSDALFDLLTRMSRESGRVEKEDREDGDRFRTWLETPWARCGSGTRRRFEAACPRGIVCALAGPAAGSTLTAERLAEELGREAGCDVLPAEMSGDRETRTVALVFSQDEPDDKMFSAMISRVANRYGFRVGISRWDPRLPENGNGLWQAALCGSVRAFYRCAAAVRCEKAEEPHAVRMPDGRVLLRWFGQPAEWREESDRLLAEILREMPEPAGLVADTRRMLEECEKLLADEDGEAERPLGDELRLVVFFNEYRACLEAALETLEARFRTRMDRNDPVEIAKAYLDRNYMNPVSLTEAAALAHVSPNYLSTLFRKNTSMRFSDYVLRVRLEKASQMLAGTDLYVYEIAKACGYEDVQYFVRVFQKNYGISPVNFRRSFGVDRPEK